VPLAPLALFLAPCQHRRALGVSPTWARLGEAPRLHGGAAMRSIPRPTALALPLSLLVGLAACDDHDLSVVDIDPAAPDAAAPSSVPDPGALAPPTSGNNSAHFDLALGSGTTPNARLRKPLALRVVGAPRDLVAGPAILSRYAPDAQSLHSIFVRLENTGSRRRCFVRAEGLRLFDDAGELVGHDPTAYLTGSVGVSASGYTTTACLAPGESGYLLGLIDGDYQAAQLLDLVLDEGDPGLGAPATSVAPGEATLTGDGLIVTAENLGPTGAKLGSFDHQWIAFDDQGWPFEFGYLAPCDQDADRELASGESLDLCASIYLAGRAASVHVYLDYQDTTTRKPAPAALAARMDDEAAGRARLRTRREGARR
jgi:hypothetical protein